MICIWGRTTKKRYRYDSDDIIGPSPPCLTAGCTGTSRLYTMARYCHVYYIPCYCCALGPRRDIVQCSTCNAMYNLLDYQVMRRRAHQRLLASYGMGNNSNVETTNQIDDLLLQDQWEQAAQQARALVEQEPTNLRLMIALHVALMGKASDPNNIQAQEEANQVLENLQHHWKSHCRQSWLSQGRPKSAATFTRLLLNNSCQDYRIEAKQFFEPEQQATGEGEEAVALYKIVALPKQNALAQDEGAAQEPPRQQSRLFKLLRVLRNTTSSSGNCSSQAPGEYHYVLQEVVWGANSTVDFRDVLAYDSYDGNHAPPPHIRKIALDVASLLRKDAKLVRAMRGLA